MRPLQIPGRIEFYRGDDMNKKNEKINAPTDIQGLGENFKIQGLFKLMVENKASDMHLSVGSPPSLRINGNIVRAKTSSLTKQDTKNLIYQVLSKDQRSELEKKMELDFSFTIKDLARFRANVFHSKGKLGAAFRLIPEIIPNFSFLNLPKILMEMTKSKNGIVLVTGGTGSGKSTTLASMLDVLNANENGHIVTIEDPIEFVHAHKGCLITQREIGRDTESFDTALRSLLRQDPDIVLIGEMRDSKTISSALTIAETGHLTFGTLHTNSCVQTLNRVINAFPAHQQEQIRTILSFTLQGIVSQQLIPKTFEKGRVLALELLIPNIAIRNLIRENKVHQIYSQMQIGQDQTGMITMNQSLEKLVSNGSISHEVALSCSSMPEELIKKFKN